MSQTASLESDMNSLSARLRKARQGLSRGTIVDLTPIEQDVKWLCRSVQALAPEEASRLRPRLVGLLEEVNQRSEEHTSELQSLMRISYAVFCLKNKNNQEKHTN